VQRDPAELDLLAVVANRLAELLLAGDPPGDRELATDVVAGLEELDPVPATGERRGGGETGGAGSDDGDAFDRAGGPEDQLGLVMPRAG